MGEPTATAVAGRTVRASDLQPWDRVDYITNGCFGIEIHSGIVASIDGDTIHLNTGAGVIEAIPVGRLIDRGHHTRKDQQ